MAWQCFLDERTGRPYKSRDAVERSKADLSEHPFVLSDEELGVFAAGLRRSDCERYSDRILDRLPCEAHKKSRVAERSASSGCVDVVLVSFDEPLLCYGPCSPSGVISEDRLDERRQRDADCAKLQSARDSLQTKFGRELLFVYTYNEEAKLRAVDALQKRKVTFHQTPVLSSVEDLIKYLVSHDFGRQ